VRYLRTFLRNVRTLFEELRNMRVALRKDKEVLKKYDPSFEAKYQFLFHAGFRSLRLYRISHIFYISGFKFIAYMIYHLNRTLYAVDIHPAARIEPGVVIDHGTGLVIGSTSVVGSGTVLYHGVTLGAKYIVSGKRHPTVGRNVIIGAGAKIFGPFSVGDGARIGANSVVINDVPKYVTVVGIPGKIVKSPGALDSKHDNSINNSKLLLIDKDDDLCLEKLESTTTSF